MSEGWVAVLIVCVTLVSSEHGSSPTAAACIFDKIQPANVPYAKVSYHNDISERRRRETNPSDEHTDSKTYQPIRIVPYFYNIDSELDDVAQQRLRTVVFAAIYRIQNILSVIPVKGSLRLQRSGCQNSFVFGVNKGKCSKIHPGYRRETCSNFIQIPDAHLSGLYTWNATYPKPVREHIAPGPGVAQADYILYVHAHQSSRCFNQAPALLAYAIYCQLDQNDRPIAGYVNFCPGRLKTDEFNQQKFYLTAIHELFHALGFSKKLYGKFRECNAAARVDESWPKCPRRNSLTGKLGGVTRFITPAVVRESQRHFTCPREQDFGAPVEIVNGRVGSHWHARFMQGSVMAPTIGEIQPAVDRITLAMFEDTGWYRVNYSQADTYTWGQGEGCQFGLESTCQNDSQYFCTGSGPGCHFTHVTKGHCDTDSTIAPCRIFMAEQEENCTIAVESPSRLSATGEVYGDKSRCFLANLTSRETSKSTDLTESRLMGKCFQYMCRESNVLFVKTSTTDWQPCPFGQLIPVEGYEGHLLCPSEGILCEDRESEISDPFTYIPPLFLATQTTSPSTTVTLQTTNPVNMNTTVTSDTAFSQSYVPAASDVMIPVVVVFPSLDVDVLKRRRLVKGFVSAVLRFVVKATNITQSRLKNTAVERGSVRVLFDIKPAEGRQEGPTSEETFEILVDCVEHGNWTVQLPALGIHKASRISKRSQVFPIRAGPPSISAGGIVGIVLGLIAVLVVLAIIIIVINKYKMTSQGSVTPTPGDASCREPSIVYTHRPGKRSGQKSSFTNLRTAKDVR